MRTISNVWYRQKLLCKCDLVFFMFLSLVISVPWPKRLAVISCNHTLEITSYRVNSSSSAICDLMFRPYFEYLCCFWPYVFSICFSFSMNFAIFVCYWMFIIILPWFWKKCYEMRWRLLNIIWSTKTTC